VAEVRSGRRAVKDLDSLPKKATLTVIAAIEKVASDPSGAGLDVKALVGRRPWRRLRVGSYRVLFRFADRQKVLLVARVIDRKRLEEAVESLPD
jgi:mRNA-degrading endonuclease RelE of RelBE toxin-antitoxin system